MVAARIHAALGAGEVITTLVGTYLPLLESHEWLAGGRPLGRGTGVAVVESAGSAAAAGAWERRVTTSAQDERDIERVTGPVREEREEDGTVTGPEEAR